MSAIRIELELKDGSFVSGMLRAGQSLESFKKELARLDPHFRKVQGTADGVIKSMNRVDASTRSLLSTLRDVSIVAGASAMAFQALTGASNGLVGNIIKVNAEMEKLKFQMIGMSQAADPIQEAAANVEYLRQKATEAPFSIRELTSTFVKLRASGIEDTNKSMQALVDGIAAFGGSDEQLHRVTLGITQMAGKGVIQMEEMRQQLGESMPTAMRLMARSMGISVAELVDAIGTGKLEAKTALAGFTAELNRAYGGSAQRMMQTFSGQVTQLQANFQRLATEEGGQLKLFFENLKGYLQEFNAFLASPQAKAMADGLGSALNSIASAGVTAAKTLYQFREELKFLLVAAAGGMALRSLSNGFLAIGQALSVAKGQMGGFLRDMAASRAAMLTGATNMTSLQGAAQGAGMVFAGLRGYITAAGSALLTFAPYIAVAVVGIGYLAEKFGILGNKTDEAYQSLLNYGAESRAQAEEIIDAKEAELMEQLEDAKWYAKYNGGRVQREQAAEDAKRLEVELEQLRSRRASMIERSGKAELEAEKGLLETKIEMNSEAAHREYNRVQTELDNQYERELAEVSAREGAKQEDIAKVQEAYRQKTLENEEKLVRAKIKIREDEIKALEAQQKAAADAGMTDEANRIAKLIETVQKGRGELVRELIQLLETGRAFGATLLAEAPEDGAKRQQKGQEELDRLREDIQGLEADIAGASGEYAKLNARIARGDYGSIEEGGEAVRQLHEELREAVRQKEALDKIMEGRSELSGDVEQLQQKIREDRLALEARKAGKDLNEAEVILERLRSGYYEGLGPIENIRAAVMNLTNVTNTQGLVAQEAARVMFEQTFGETMLAQVDKLKVAIEAVTGAIFGMSGAASGFTGFANFAGGFGMPGLTDIRTNVDGGILDLIARRESGGDYNATLDNGRWTGGPRNLTSMTLAQVRALQDQMLANPENRAMYGDGLGSSALGRYQIVGKTLEGLINELGLDRNALYDEEMQDMLAKVLLKRRGANPDALRAEWAGLKGVSDADIMAAIARSTNGPTGFDTTNASTGQNAGAGLRTAELPKLSLGAPMNTKLFDDQVQAQIAYGQEYEKILEGMAEEISRMDAETDDLELGDAMKALKDDLLDANKPLEEMGKNTQKVMDAIRNGDLGADKNVESERYKEILRLAKELDAAETARDDRKKATDASEEQRKKLEEDRVQLQREIADAQARAKNPDYEGQSDDLAKLNAEFDEYLENIRIAYGAESQQYKDALAYKQQYLGDAQALQRATIQADLAAQERDLQDSLLNERDLRRVQMERELAMLDAKAEQLRAAGMSEVEITETIERMKAQIREKYAQDSIKPIGEQMKEWADLQGNLEKASVRWMDSAAAGITGLITGTGDLRSAVNGILNDMVNMGVKFAMSQLMPQGGKAGAGKAQNIAGKAATGGKMPIGVKHTGGIVGSGAGVARMANLSSFSGAKKFHTGGIVGGVGSLSLRKNEVPIIAQKGEGVFTPDQMKALGGFSSSQQFQINAPVTVNGSAGTPDQNADLAKRISQEMEGTMRMVVIDEMRKQIRPGNMMNNGSR